MLTVVAYAFIACAVVMVLRNAGGSPRRAFDTSRERLRADANNPSKVAVFYVVLAAFIGIGLLTGSGNWKGALFAFAFGSAFITAVFWAARR